MLLMTLSFFLIISIIWGIIRSFINVFLSISDGAHLHRFLLCVLWHFHIILLIYENKEDDALKGLHFAKSSDNHCVTTHSIDMQTRHPLPTSGTIHENENLCSQSAVGHLSVGAWDFLDRVQSSSNQLATISQKENGQVIYLGMDLRASCPGCPHLLWSSADILRDLSSQICQVLPNLGHSNYAYSLSLGSPLSQIIDHLIPNQHFGIYEMSLSQKKPPWLPRIDQNIS